MVRLGRLELPTLCLKGKCCYRLSYWGKYRICISCESWTHGLTVRSRTLSLTKLRGHKMRRPSFAPHSGTFNFHSANHTIYWLIWQLVSCTSCPRTRTRTQSLALIWYQTEHKSAALPLSYTGIWFVTGIRTLPSNSLTERACLTVYPDWSHCTSFRFWNDLSAPAE